MIKKVKILTNSNTDFHSVAQETSWTVKKTTCRSGQNSDSDSDFDPENRRKVSEKYEVKKMA